MPNQALDTNPPTGSVQHITTHGSDWLWAVFAIMTFTDIVVFFWQFTLPRGQRVFHQLAMFILTTAAIAYFSMASDLGYASILTEFGHMGYSANTTRQIWYVRYIDWVITTPSLLLTLVLASGLPLSDIIALCYFDLVMIVTGLVGALVATSYKWGFYAFGCAALFYIWWVLAGPARASAGALGADYKSAFTSSAAILSFLWLLYPIAWGLADGGNVITPDSEMVFYGVLDVLAKPVFTIYHLYRLSKVDLSLLQLSSGKFSTSGGVFDREKHAAAGAPATVGVPGTGTAGAAKGGFFSRKGHRDAVAEPRTSEATAVNA
uniref:Family A G protein-coupled receptor-like protein n=2 Tax=Kwoniella bestiolae CBS 10118 TaxID=1296100 RepID=A0A1B9GBB4_9TREE|nr:hypothetical protein I302_03155 [Kwoniella bestiolae CBS 10118]OCF28299.1 hypothetical protein I302_03155 [Kwoniella bestiolae CBS 10118]